MSKFFDKNMKESHLDPKDKWQLPEYNNPPIIRYLNSIDGTNLTLLDLGCGRGTLSEVAIQRGFKVTSVDWGNTPYEKTIRKDTKTIEGYFDYIIGAGFPPNQLPKNIQYMYSIFSTSRRDFIDRYPGDYLFKLGTVRIRTNIKDFNKRIRTTL